MTHNPDVWTDWLGYSYASVPLSGSQHKDALSARKKLLAVTNWNPNSVRVTRVRVTNHGTAIYQLLTK